MGLILAAVWAVVLLTGCTSAMSTSATTSASGASGATGVLRPGAAEDLATGLEVPWGLAFLPRDQGFAAGSAILGHRDSYDLSFVTADGKVWASGSLPRFEGRTGEAGLLGLAVYPQSLDLYAYLTTGDDNRLLRVRLGSSGGAPTIASVDVLLKGIPRNVIHDGGAVAVGPDGMLYVSTGETGRPALAQDKSSYAGKILRLTPDGKVPADNPFPGSAVYSYGHRNVQGLAFDEGGRLWASEFGQNALDEVNLIRAGGNYGWPAFEGTRATGDFELPAEAQPIAPLVTFSTTEASPSGIAVVGGALYLAALRGERLLRIPIEGNALGKPEAVLTDLGRIRGVAVTPDKKSLWTWTNNTDGRGNPRGGDDRILRIPLGP